MLACSIMFTSMNCVLPRASRLHCFMDSPSESSQILWWTTVFRLKFLLAGCCLHRAKTTNFKPFGCFFESENPRSGRCSEESTFLLENWRIFFSKDQKVAVGRSHFSFCDQEKTKRNLLPGGASSDTLWRHLSPGCLWIYFVASGNSKRKTSWKLPRLVPGGGTVPKTYCNGFLENGHFNKMQDYPIWKSRNI